MRTIDIAAYPSGCIRGGNGRVVFNTRISKTTECGAYSSSCVCYKQDGTTAAPTAANEAFKITKKGVCESVSRQTCQNEAVKEGRSFQDKNDLTEPKGCFYDLFGQYYNTAESSRECYDDSICYCRVEEEKEAFKITKKGVCKSVSRQTCQNEAVKEGRSFQDKNDLTEPKGCFYDIFGQYYNTAESSRECYAESICYCRVEEEKEEFKITEKGTCKSVSKQTCQNEATKEGRSFKEVTDISEPAGCFYDIFGQYYNLAESSRPCYADSKCYCRVEEEKEGKTEEFKITEKGVCGKS